jgi:hypothetical protein
MAPSMSATRERPSQFDWRRGNNRAGARRGNDNARRTKRGRTKIDPTLEQILPGCDLKRLPIEFPGQYFLYTPTIELYYHYYLNLS